MVRDIFETLLEETGQLLDVPRLHPDQNNSCLIKLKSGVQIQLELDRKADFLILAINIGTPQGGRYRENLLRQALKANDLLPKQQGVFAFSTKTEHLLLMDKLALKDLNGQKIAATVTALVKKAAIWSEALTHNDVPEIDQDFTSDVQTGMFGLRK